MAAENDKHASVDPKEVELFSKMVDDWWDEKGSQAGLHAMNKVRLPFLQESLMRNGQVKEGDVAGLADVQVLDVGCGGGIMAEAVAKMGYKVTGIDPSEELIAVGTKHAAQQEGLDITYLSTSIEEHSATCPNKYDAVIASEVVEHVADTRPFLHSCVAALKPGGSLIISTINRTFIAWLVYVLLLEYILRMIPTGTHQYKKLVKPEEIEEQLKEVNCSVKRVQGTRRFIPFINRWSWTSSLSINYILHAVKND